MPIYEYQCKACGHEMEAFQRLSDDPLKECPACGARLRPHIVWFGEVPFELDRIADALARADLFVTIGSSGAVYPAAGFVARVRQLGRARTVYVGPERPDNASSFDEIRLGKAGDVVPSLFSVRAEPQS